MDTIFPPKVIFFENPLAEASIIKREKRFFVEFTWEELAQGQIPKESLWAHTNNTGSMMGLIRKGRRILLSKASNPKRKLGWTLEAICTQPELLGKEFLGKEFLGAELPEKNLTRKKILGKELLEKGLLEKEFLGKENNLLFQGKSPWLGVNTSLPNKFLQALFSMKDKDNKALLPWTEGYNHIRMEATNGESRLDACITYKDEYDDGHNNATAIGCGEEKYKSKPNLWVECKNISLVEDDIAAFPDAISLRGLKHLETLMRIVKEGQRAAMLYVVQRTDASCFSSADYIDINYSRKLVEAYRAGVEIYVIVANVQKDGVYFGGTLPLASPIING